VITLIILFALGFLGGTFAQRNAQGKIASSWVKYQTFVKKYERSRMPFFPAVEAQWLFHTGAVSIELDWCLRGICRDAWEVSAGEVF
jgi:hypothetical protein